MPTVTTSFQHSIRSSSHSNQTTKINKNYANRNGRGKIVIICRCRDITCVCVLVVQLCLTLCNPMDCSLPGLSVHGIFQARILAATAAVKSLQSCPALCDPIDGRPPGSSVPGILQARTLEWVAISFSKAWKWKVKVKSFSRVLLFVTPWSAAHQAPPSMGFSRQEYWNGLSFPSAGDLPDPEIKPRSSAFQADALPSELLGFLLHIANPKNSTQKLVEWI